MILVCGGLADAVTELVCSRLAASGYDYRLLDQSRYPTGFTVHWEWIDGAVHGTISGNGWRLPLDQLTGIYIRFLSVEGRLPLSALSAEMVAGVHSETDAGLTALFEHLPCTVVNRSRGSISNHSKPYQALLLQRCGFRVPETLVTNDPDEAHAFYKEHSGDVIYKSLSGIRSIVRRLSPEQLSRLPLLRHGPAQFQRHIPGDNVRVHVVGERVFATRVQSDAVDYRYATQEGRNYEMTEELLPSELEAACVLITRRLDLMFSGIDLKITPEGKFFCFEVNPCPGFSFYELGTGQPISAALADLLHAPPSDPDGERSHPQLAGERPLTGL